MGGGAGDHLICRGYLVRLIVCLVVYTVYVFVSPLT